MADPYNSQLFSQLAQMSQSSGNKFACGWLPLGDVNAFAGLGLANCAPFGKNIPALFAGTGKPGCLGDKFLQAVMQASDQVKQCAQQAGVMYAGEVTRGSSVSSGLGSSGGGMDLAAG